MQTTSPNFSAKSLVEANLLLVVAVKAAADAFNGLIRRGPHNRLRPLRGALEPLIVRKVRLGEAGARDGDRHRQRLRLEARREGAAVGRQQRLAGRVGVAEADGRGGGRIIVLRLSYVRSRELIERLAGGGGRWALRPEERERGAAEAGVAGLPEAAADRHNASLLLLDASLFGNEKGQKGFGDGDGAEVVDSEARRAVVRVDTGVVHEHVEAVLVLLELRDGRGNGRGVAEVELDDRQFVVLAHLHVRVLVRDGHHSVAGFANVAAAQNDGVALFKEVGGYVVADALIGAGDESDGAVGHFMDLIVSGSFKESIGVGCVSGKCKLVNVPAEWLLVF